MEDNILGGNIKALREKSCMTQELLAKKLFADRTLISRWETGHRKPKMSEIEKMAEIFGVDVEELLNCNIGQTGDTDNNKEKDKMVAENCNYKTETLNLFGRDAENDYGYLLVPRIILSDTDGYKEYMKGLDLDVYLDDHPEDVDKVVEMTHSYWKAFDEGIAEAGVNLLRHMFLVKIKAKYDGDPDALQEKFMHLIEGLQAIYHPAGDFYHALALFCGLLDNDLSDDECIDDGLKELYELANDGNIYAEEVVNALEGEECEIEE